MLLNDKVLLICFPTFIFRHTFPLLLLQTLYLSSRCSASYFSITWNAFSELYSLFFPHHNSSRSPLLPSISCLLFGDVMKHCLQLVMISFGLLSLSCFPLRIPFYLFLPCVSGRGLMTVCSQMSIQYVRGETLIYKVQNGILRRENPSYMPCRIDPG